MYCNEILCAASIEVLKGKIYAQLGRKYVLRLQSSSFLGVHVEQTDETNKICTSLETVKN